MMRLERMERGINSTGPPALKVVIPTGIMSSGFLGGSLGILWVVSGAFFMEVLQGSF